MDAEKNSKGLWMIQSHFLILYGLVEWNHKGFLLASVQSGDTANDMYTHKIPIHLYMVIHWENVHDDHNAFKSKTQQQIDQTNAQTLSSDV